MPDTTPRPWPPQSRSAITPWIPALLWALVLFLLSAQSELPAPGGLRLHDKVAHFLAFGVLGAALGYGRARSRRRVPHWLVVASGVAYGVLDEIHQSFVPNRDPSLGDVVADALGVGAGYGAAMVAVALTAARLGGRRSDRSAR